MGLGQDDCGEYVQDKQSRGAGRFGGCASCIHREPYNTETQKAEDYHRNHAQIKETAQQSVQPTDDGLAQSDGESTPAVISG